MPRFQAEALRQLGVDLFTKIDVPADEAELVAGHMVESGLYGHDSHSVLRYPQYVELVRKGDVIPGAQLEIVTETDRVAQVKGNWNFGPVTAAAAMKIAMAKARDGALGVVTIKECNHVARLGSFARMAADETMIAMMCCNGHGGDHSTVPFGGSQRRLPTNPLAVAIPTRHEWPVLLDMTTSAISGGAMRLFRNRGEPVPEDCIIDSDGSPTTDVEEYYGPPSGALLPLGFPMTGHKGFGLAFVIDILAGALSGAGCTRESPPRSGNALFIAVLNIEAFTPLAEFLDEVERYIGWVKSSRLADGFDEILFPGEKSNRTYRERVRDGLYVDETAWRQIYDLAEELEVAAPEPVS